MKKVMYLIGFIGVATMAGGITLKSLSMSGGYQFIMIGFTLILLIFIPILAYDKYKLATTKTLSLRLKIILGGASAVIAGMSGLFKLMHLHGAEYLLILGTFVFIVGFLPFFFYSMYLKSITK